MAQCPECEAMIELDPDELAEGELVTCPDCSCDLEVISTEPLEFNVVDDIDERDEMDDDFAATDDDDDEDEDDDLDEDEDEDDYDEDDDDFADDDDDDEDK